MSRFADLSIPLSIFIRTSAFSFDVPPSKSSCFACLNPKSSGLIVYSKILSSFTSKILVSPQSVI